MRSCPHETDVQLRSKMGWMRTHPDRSSELAGFSADQWAERRSRLEGWLAGRTGTWKTDGVGRDGVRPPPTNPPTVNRLGGQCRSQSPLPSSELLGDCSAGRATGQH